MLTRSGKILLLAQQANARKAAATRQNRVQDWIQTQTSSRDSGVTQALTNDEVASTLHSPGDDDTGGQSEEAGYSTLHSPGDDDTGGRSETANPITVGWKDGKEGGKSDFDAQAVAGVNTVVSSSRDIDLAKERSSVEANGWDSEDIVEDSCDGSDVFPLSPMLTYGRSLFCGHNSVNSTLRSVPDIHTASQHAYQKALSDQAICLITHRVHTVGTGGQSVEAGNSTLHSPGDDGTGGRSEEVGDTTLHSPGDGDTGGRSEEVGNSTLHSRFDDGTGGRSEVVGDSILHSPGDDDTDGQSEEVGDSTLHSPVDDDTDGQSEEVGDSTLHSPGDGETGGRSEEVGNSTLHSRGDDGTGGRSEVVGDSILHSPGDDDTDGQSEEVGDSTLHSPVDDDTDGQSEEVGDSIRHSPGDDDTGEFSVPKVKPTSNQPGKRKYDKRHYCIYCKESFAHLPRHLYGQHAEERDVAELMAADAERRKTLLMRIRNLGAEQHNAQVSKDGIGYFAVVYRPTWSLEATNYQSCEWCHGSYRPRQLWRHKRNCKLKPVHANGSVRKMGSRPVLLRDIPPEVEMVIAGLQSGPERLVIKNDTLMHLFATQQIERVAHSKHHINYIRSRLRTLARLIIQVRKEDSRLRSADLECVLAPKFFRSVIEAVKVIAGYDNETHAYAAPSVAVRLGHDVRKCAQLKRNRAMEREDTITADSAHQFNELCATQWNDNVSGAARRVLQNRKINKHFLLPLAADVSKLTTHVKEVVNSSVNVIRKKEYDATFVEAFKSLAEALLAALILFNRRRQGEVSRLTISLYHSSAVHQRQASDIDSSLSPLERHLMHAFHRVEVPGKRNRCVPLLMTADQKAAVEILISSQIRAHAGIHSDNQFVFPASKGSLNPIRGNDVMRNFALLCGAQNPSNLTSTNLRKHIATLSQVMNLQANELDQLAGFMGHDVRVHREFYRLPNDVYQTAKVTKILIAMEKGLISDVQGKTLDEVQVLPDDAVESDSDAAGNKNSFADDEDDNGSTQTDDEACADDGPPEADEQQLICHGKHPKGPPARGLLHVVEGRRRRTAEDQAANDDEDWMPPKRKHPKGPPARGLLHVVEGRRRRTTEDQAANDDEDWMPPKRLQRKPKCTSSGSRWTDDQRTAIVRQLGHLVRLKRVPSKSDCEKCIGAETVLEGVPWRRVKDLIYAKIQKDKDRQ